MRFEKGLTIFPIINFTLLVISASDKLKYLIPLSTTGIVLTGVPCALAGVWLVGYLMTKPTMQRNEDRALDDLMPMRRDIRKILKAIEDK